MPDSLKRDLCIPLHWRHNGRDCVSNHQPLDCLLNRLFRSRSKKTSKLRVTGLCEGNSPGTGEFPAHMASNAENVSIWWRHHAQFEPWHALCSRHETKLPSFGSLLKHRGRHFANKIYAFSWQKKTSLLLCSPKLVPNDAIDNQSSLEKVMAKAYIIRPW